MLRVRKSQVPTYLQEGEFFQSLDGYGDEEVEVPSTALKPDAAVFTAADLRHLLLSLRFWIVIHLPRSLIEYVMTHDVDVTETVLTEFSEHNVGLHTLWSIKKAYEYDRMELVIKSGILEIVEYLFVKENNGNYCHIAAKYGQLACLKYFHNCGAKWDYRTTKAAALFGHLDCLQYAMENDCATKGPMLKRQYPSKVFICTVAVTNPAALMQYNDNATIGSIWQEGLSEVTAASKLACLRYLRAQNVQWNWTAFRNAAAAGDLDTVTYLHEHGCPTHNGEDVCTAATLFGHLDCLQYLHEQGYKWNIATVTTAITAGHLHCLQYLFENGCPWHGDVCAFAANDGQLECLKYLHTRGCPWDAYACTKAAEGGHLDCLQYAHENGCEWDGGTTHFAAAWGHLDCLAYALENGCEYDERVVVDTAYSGHVDCLRYLVEHGYPCDVVVLATKLEVANGDGASTRTPNAQAVIDYLNEIVSQR